MSIRIFIEHDVRLVREGITALLKKYSDICALDANSRFLHEKSQIETDSLDIVILQAPAIKGELARQINQIKRTLPNVQIIVIGVPDTTIDILDCIEQGASAYLTLEDSLEYLVDIIQAVYRREGLCPPGLLPALYTRLAFLSGIVRSLPDSELTKLTQRELQVLQLVADGMSNKEIAAYLNLELQTVKNYVHKILEKLGTHNRREAGLCARRLQVG